MWENDRHTQTHKKYNIKFPSNKVKKPLPDMETQRLNAGSIIDSVASYGRVPVEMLPQKRLESTAVAGGRGAALSGLVKKCSPEVFRLGLWTSVQVYSTRATHVRKSSWRSNWQTNKEKQRESERHANRHTKMSNIKFFSNKANQTLPDTETEKQRTSLSKSQSALDPV